MKDGSFPIFQPPFVGKLPNFYTEQLHNIIMNDMQKIVNRANEIINERMNTWCVDETNMGTSELQQLQKCAFEIARNEFMIGLI